MLIAEWDTELFREINWKNIWEILYGTTFKISKMFSWLFFYALVSNLCIEIQNYCFSFHEVFLISYNCRQAVIEDKALIYEDWKESILPLLDLAPSNVNPKFFGVEQYFAAKSLISSRSFEIDDYHGFGMVPLADL